MDFEKALATTAQAFLDAGADVHAKIRSPAYVSGSHLDSTPEKCYEALVLQLDLELSPLNLVRSLVRYVPEWKPVEEMILAKGGCDFYKHTHVHVYSETHWQFYKIPKSQHENLVTALNGSYDLYANQPSSGTSWKPIMTKICSEHLDSLLFTNSQKISSDGISSDADAEDEDYEPHDIQHMENVQDSRTIG